MEYLIRYGNAEFIRWFLNEFYGEICNKTLIQTKTDYINLYDVSDILSGQCDKIKIHSEDEEVIEWAMQAFKSDIAAKKAFLVAPRSLRLINKFLPMIKKVRSIHSAEEYKALLVGTVTVSRKLIKGIIKQGFIDIVHDALLHFVNDFDDFLNWYGRYMLKIAIKYDQENIVNMIMDFAQREGKNAPKLPLNRCYILSRPILTSASYQRKQEDVLDDPQGRQVILKYFRHFRTQTMVNIYHIQKCSVTVVKYLIEIGILISDDCINKLMCEYSFHNQQIIEILISTFSSPHHLLKFSCSPEFIHWYANKYCGGINNLITNIEPLMPKLLPTSYLSALYTNKYFVDRKLTVDDKKLISAMNLNLRYIIRAAH
jgi:hypothetical protein